MCEGSSVAASLNPFVRHLRAHRLCVRAWQRLWGSCVCLRACLCADACACAGPCARAFVPVHAGIGEFLCVRLGVGVAFLSASIFAHARVSVLNMCVCGSAVCVPRVCVRVWTLLGIRWLGRRRRARVRGCGSVRSARLGRASAAGATFTSRTLTAGWAARQGHTSVVGAAGAIYVIGGIKYGGTVYQDVWVSTDGGAQAGLRQGGLVGGTGEHWGVLGEILQGY